MPEIPQEELVKLVKAYREPKAITLVHNGKQYKLTVSLGLPTKLTPPVPSPAVSTIGVNDGTQ